MKSFIFSILIGCILLATSCGKRDSKSRSNNSHKMETQVVRLNGGLRVLSVISESDVKGIMSIQENHSQVAFSYGGGDDVVIKLTQITIRGTLWGEIPEETQKVLIEYYDSKFNVKLDPEA